MNRKLLSKAVGNIDDSFIAEAYRPVNDDIVGSPERIVHMKPKRLFTLALAAALILSLGIAAYAVWSIHIARQQEIPGQAVRQAFRLNTGEKLPQKFPFQTSHIQQSKNFQREP